MKKEGIGEMRVNIAKDSTKVYSEDGNLIFQEALILRKVSKFLTGAKEDQVIPITVFIDMKTGKINKEFLPKELWADYGFEDETPKEEVVTTAPIMSLNKD